MDFLCALYFDVNVTKNIFKQVWIISTYRLLLLSFIFLYLLPLGVAKADHLSPSHPVSSLFFCHANPQHVLTFTFSVCILMHSFRQQGNVCFFFTKIAVTLWRHCLSAFVINILNILHLISVISQLLCITTIGHYHYTGAATTVAAPDVWQ